MLLPVEAVGLACLTILLAGPASAALADAQWTARSPRAALFLWQAVGLAGGLGVLTAGLTLAAASVGNRWLPGLIDVPSHWSQLGVSGWLGVAVTVSVGTWLVVSTAASAARVLRARREHRRRLDAIGDALRVGPPVVARGGLRVRLVDHPQAVAYCLPGLRPRVVLSSGALAALTTGELDAVLAHELAHARGRHDLVVQPFVAWARTFPFLPTAARAVAAVGALVEMLADDAALQRCGPEDLRNALRRLAGEQSAVTGPAGIDLGRQLGARADRLAATTRTLGWPVTALVYAAAAALVVGPPLILLYG
ncbi:MAG TPA: M56 family metallopeptidase [Actinomycetota bacterium]|nr:M56 family metallopeptidase [Actinomycetota bacterium]